MTIFSGELTATIKKLVNKIISYLKLRYTVFHMLFEFI